MEGKEDGWIAQFFRVDVEFNCENFREARRGLDRLAASITCINVAVLSFFFYLRVKRYTYI